MQVTTPALVISSLKYSEADLIVRCFTRESGLKTYLLKGVLKSRKGKFKKALFLPLSLLELQATHKDKGTLEFLKEASLLHPYSTVHTQMDKQGLVMFLSEILQMAIQEEEQNTMLYDFLEESFLWLDKNEHVANFHILFLLKLSEHLGFYPDAYELNHECFHLEEGIFMPSRIDPLCVCGQVVDHFKQFFGIDFDAMNDVKLTKQQRLSVLNLLLQYYQLHLQNYKEPKSLSVLNQLFS